MENEEIQTTVNESDIDELGGETINVIYDTNEVAE
jgi:hypothetical protein